MQKKEQTDETNIVQNTLNDLQKAHLETEEYISGSLIRDAIKKKNGRNAKAKRLSYNARLAGRNETSIYMNKETPYNMLKSQDEMKLS